MSKNGWPSKQSLIAQAQAAAGTAGINANGGEVLKRGNYVATVELRHGPESIIAKFDRRDGRWTVC